MNRSERIARFYQQHLPNAVIKQHMLVAPCPFCQKNQTDPNQSAGTLLVVLNPDSFFLGYFRCKNRCIPGGFPIHFGRLMGLDLTTVPGYDPDREPFVLNIVYPSDNQNDQVETFMASMGEEQYAHFAGFGVSRSLVKEMKIGYNGRYLTYPYYLDDGNCYAIRCILPDRPEDHFWHGNEDFFQSEFTIFNLPEIQRCEDGAIFVVEGEDNLLALRELGYPAIAVPSAADMEVLDPQRLALIRHVFLVPANTPEANISARSLALRLGFRARILSWPPHLGRGYSIRQLAEDRGDGFRKSMASLIQSARAFSPFNSPEKEHREFFQMVEKEQGKKIPGLPSGFEKLDNALGGMRGINILGGQPKVGKSSFFMQMSTEMARRQIPIIYYDFENGRQKIYTRTLCRLARLSDTQIRQAGSDPTIQKRIQAVERVFQDLLFYFRVVTDRKLTPDVMRRQIEFLKLETHKDELLVVVDSLHKLPFKDLSERRTGIDSWLRHMEAIRDEYQVAFLVISELNREAEGKYSQTPDIAAFKGSGDIEYSADNAMILVPEWNVFDSQPPEKRQSSLWVVASRENTPGRVASYALEYPYWGFREL